MARVAQSLRGPKTYLGRVLVVDDDPGMRRLCGRVLGNEGWDVVVVDGGKAALDCVADPAAPFDCIVSDVHMPGMDGFALIAEIRRHDDDLPVLLMTGDSGESFVPGTAYPVLRKPFSEQQLVEAVRLLLPSI